ncbi:tRNAHis guanylyltransferase-domain-containing protein [Gorgonomyces haynaldii]|nr:tRNAHis guanylyltransferase-domain-containing protein [Gorgonomyces haynaldii]
MSRQALKSLKTIYDSQIAEKMKALESQFDLCVKGQYMIRLDGVAFHTFLKGVRKPFDDRITDAMVKTCHDLVLKFNPHLCYTHSDEISLVFLNADMYNGRIQKLASVTASFASCRFNYHLCQPIDQWHDLLPVVQQRLLGSTAYFDGRVIPFPDTESILECLLWRSNLDGFRNGVTQVALCQYGNTHKQSCASLLDKLEGDGIDVFEKYGKRSFFGTLLKKEQYLTTGHNPKTGETIGDVVRTRVRTGSVNMESIDRKQMYAFIESPFWTDDPSFPPKDAITNK